jgi:hypothetical protein
MWNSGLTGPGSSKVAIEKSTVSGWKSDLTINGVPQSGQKERLPKLELRIQRGSPLVQTKSPTGSPAKAIAGAPLLSWQVRQWHQPASKGSLFNSKRTAPQRHPPVIPISFAFN